MDRLKQIFGGDTRQFGMIFALAAMIVLFQILTDGLTLKAENVINIFQGNSYILVMAIGMVLVIIAGHIDLSVGSVAAFAGIVVAMAMRDWSLPWWAGILLLGRVRRHPGFHRHARGHAHLPWCQPARRPLQHGARG
jgi:putative multiple sugar transport system permease protein